MIKLIINYTQDWNGKTLEDSYSRYFGDDENIEREKFEIEQRLFSDPCVNRVWFEVKRR